jgi:Formate hydrogenlyase subunit 6/NADH:ubiquinone oxidoreductase 23 kD subunit (chain I)
MAIKVKVVERPTDDVSYIRATLKGMALTAKHLFDVQGRVTTQYPEEKSPISPRWRGTHRMLTTETGKARCVACGLCPTVCPANCIKLVPGEDEEGNRYPVFRSTSSAASSAGSARRSAPRKRSTWGATMRTPSTAGRASFTTCSG